MTYDLVWISALIGRIVIRKITGIRIEVVIGTFLYGLYLISVRLLKKSINWGKFVIGLRRQIPQIKRLPAPERVSDYNRYYRLKGMEVIAAQDGSHPVRIDLDKFHTLLASTTGGGKTTELNSFLIQLVDRPEFDTLYNIYLIDLKNSEKDFLWKWKPILHGYYTLDEENSTAEAVAAIEDILTRMHNSGKKDKKIIVFIDEFATFTEYEANKELRKRAEECLPKMTAQLRDKGAIVAATQRPYYKTIARNITGNLERKICFRVDDIETARLVLRTNHNPKYDFKNFKNGEFVMIEPGRGEIHARTINVSPEEIDVVVSSKIDLYAEDDPRLGLFKYIASTLPKYGAVPGINKVYGGFDGLNQKEVESYYRNFINAQALIPNVDKNGKNKGNKLADEYQTCMARVRQHIASGKWEEGPKPIGR